MVALFLDSPELKTSAGQTLALGMAVERQCLGTVGTLMDRGAPLWTPAEARALPRCVWQPPRCLIRPLAGAAARPEFDHEGSAGAQIFRRLLASPGALGALHADWATEDTPAHYAAYHGNRTALCALLARGALLEPPHPLREAAPATPLMMAAYGGQAATVALLVEQGANPAALDHKGRNAFHHLASGRHRLDARAFEACAWGRAMHARGVLDQALVEEGTQNEIGTRTRTRL